MQSSVRNTLLIGVALGLLIGLGGYTFIYSKGYSYLTNNPAACANCHVMRAQYDAWLKSSHHGGRPPRHNPPNIAEVKTGLAMPKAAEKPGGMN
jgi:hypothetical protein